jgi:processive 1,2-diacylglycerol beta-glucosyltransferase
MPASKRILLLSVSAGAGHGRAAEALRAQAHSDGITAEHIDVMTWAYLYHATDKMPRDALFAKFQRAVERLNTLKLRDTIEEFAPEHIICTHFLPAELLAHHIKRGRSVPPVWVQVTDFGLHRMWV